MSELATNPATESTLSARLARLAPWTALAYGLALMALDAATVPSVTGAVVLTALGYCLLTALVLLTAAGLAAARMPRWAEPLLLAGGVVVWSSFVHAVPPNRPLPIWASAGAAVAMMVATVGLARVLVTWVLREKNLLPVCLVLMGVVDLWGVTFGFTAHALATNPDAVAKASAALPAVQSSMPLPPGFSLPDLSIGPGDVLFMALVLGVVVRHGLPLAANLKWMFGLLLVGLGLAFGTPWAIPGLIFIGAAGLVANRGQWDYSEAEKRSLKLAAAIMLPVLVVAGWLYQARQATLPAPAEQMDRGNHGKG